MRSWIVAGVVLSCAAARPGADAARPGSAPRLADVPFTSTRPGEVIVAATVGDRRGVRLLVDTGSTHTAVTAALADALDVRPVAKTEMTSVGQTVTCPVVALPRLAIGDAPAASADDLTATVLPREGEAALGRGVDGILGQDFLARFSYTIDYRRARIAWHGPEDQPTDGVRLMLVPDRGRFLVELPQRDDRPSEAHRFVPDSGADGLVLFGDARATALVTEWRAGPALLASAAGLRGVRTALVDGLRVGGIILDRQLAAVVRYPPPTAGAADGLLPLHLFARATFNARSRVLVLQPR
jgi:hypothetical protein